MVCIAHYGTLLSRSNMGQEWGQHNGFMMTSKAIRRFGLFDENIYPAYCEDWDMMRRVKLADPPLKEHTYFDVLAVHGKRTDTSYYPGGYLPDDPNVPVSSRGGHLV
jgi:GT2 family glycosyltransferase